MPNVEGLRYPAGGDVPNVPAVMQNLVIDINRRFTQTTADVSTLSALTGMIEGDQVYLVSNGITVKYSGLVDGWVNHRNDWIIPSSLGGWSLFGSPNYDTVAYILRRGVVHIRGSVYNGSLNGVIFTLPVGMRPARHKLFVGASAAGGNARVHISPAGEVIPVNVYNGGSTGFISLNNMIYPPEQ